MDAEFVAEHAEEDVAYAASGRGKLYWHLLAALPAVAMGAVSLVFVWKSFAMTETAIRRRYTAAAARELDASRDVAGALFLKKLLHFNEHDGWARLQLALLADRQGDRDRARRLMRQVAEFDPYDHATAHLWLALDELGGGSPASLSSEARARVQRHLEQAVKLAPWATKARGVLGQFYLQDQQPDLAAEQLAAIEDEAPQWRIPLARLTASQGRGGQARLYAESAEKHYRALLTRNADDRDARIKLAEALAFLKRFDEAVDVLGQAGDDPSGGIARSLARVHFVAGTLELQRGRLDSARRHLEAAQRGMPDEPAVLNNLAWVALDSDPPDGARALELVESALELAPEEAEIRETRGQVFLKLGRWEAAVRDLTYALEHLPDEPSVHAGLAEAYEQIGNAQSAAKHRERLAELAPIRPE